MESKGHVSQTGGPAGHLNIRVTIEEHKIFKRKEYDIYSEVVLTAAQAASGVTIEIPTLEGVSLLIVPAGISPNSQLRLRGKGISHPPPNTYKRGDHLITIRLL